MRTSDFDYALPPELIAQTPLEPRDSSRLMVVDRSRGILEHRRFRDLVEYLRPGDLLVANSSRVIPARLAGVKEGTGTPVEMLLLRPAGKQTPPLPLGEGRGEGSWRPSTATTLTLALSQRERESISMSAPALPGSDVAEHTMEWEVLLKPARRVKAGGRMLFGDGELAATVLSTNGLGVRTVRLESMQPLASVVDRLGRLPLPPYIRGYSGDPGRYQTIYADAPGSAAAPTAGLHFTEELMDRVRGAGARFAFVTLHIGIDTFRPVQEEDPTLHPMHREHYEVSEETAEEINAAVAEGRRVIAVGTTSVRVLESASRGVSGGRVRAGAGWTDLFIYPGYRFGVVDALVTNFHLPRSTLIMLASAFAGHDLLARAYREAVNLGYRFYSFGDAMVVV